LDSKFDKIFSSLDKKSGRYKKEKEIMMADIKYEIKKELGNISESAKGWTKEVNLISWNGAAPKYDIRDWAPEHEKMGKGITLTKEEVQQLYKILGEIVADET
jgi:Uncharacterized protein conserved in bacteria